MKKVGIVIVNYNGGKYQNECIKSLLNASYENIEIIIVDNGSEDNSMQMLDAFPSKKIHRIYLNENFGVAKGNNIGIKKSIELDCNYTLLLNNDTVVNAEFLSKLLEKTKIYSIVVPKIYFYGTNKIWYGGGVFNKIKATNIHLNYGEEDFNIKYNDYYEYAPTCCMLINNSIFEKVGLMDEKYFLYFDDADFCFRLKLAGIKIGFCVDSIIYHKVSLSTGGNQSKISVYYGNRNRFYFRKKYEQYFGIFSYLFIKITRKIKYISGVLKKNNNILIKKAIRDYKQGKMGRCDDL